jgi:hypothetical protein
MPTVGLKKVVSLIDDFERVFESHPNAQRKHLLHRLVKEVRVQDRDTAKVWYSFPRPAASDQRTADSHIWLRGLVSVRTAKTRAKRAWRLERGPDPAPNRRPARAYWTTVESITLGNVLRATPT